MKLKCPVKTDIAATYKGSQREIVNFQEFHNLQYMYTIGIPDPTVWQYVFLDIFVLGSLLAKYMYSTAHVDFAFSTQSSWAWTKRGQPVTASVHALSTIRPRNTAIRRGPRVSVGSLLPMVYSWYPRYGVVRDDTRCRVDKQRGKDQ